jgi:BirA family transcriptional regulator, biotin operon repressor / biotin---[acetyl-CoA-carboxylase] ligase
VYKIHEQTLFTGKNVVFEPECASTNDLAMKLIHHEEGIMEGTVVITNNQTAGKGQRGNSWVAAPGQNLTFSLILKPTFLPVKDQFYLTMSIALAVHDYLVTRTDKPVYIKWPNDVLIEDHKICGILIENSIQGHTFKAAVAGIGLNVLQEDFGLLKATSLRTITGMELSLADELNRLLLFVEQRYLQLRQLRMIALRNDYRKVLYRVNQTSQFTSQDKVFAGRIKGVDETGKLMVDTETGMQSFAMKEIAFA